VGSSIFRFEKFYTDLIKVLRRRSGNATGSETDTPPLATTVPLNLQHSSPSTASTTSTSSKESGAEYMTHDLANAFLWACLYTLKHQLANCAWYPKNYLLDTMFYSMGA
jgi:hypothetical protein